MHRISGVFREGESTARSRIPMWPGWESTGSVALVNRAILFEGGPGTSTVWRTNGGVGVKIKRLGQGFRVVRIGFWPVGSILWLIQDNRSDGEIVRWLQQPIA
jgi:hypothetical protein